MLYGENEGSNLLVDFGIHSCASVWKNTYGDRQNLIKGIAEDIVKRYEQVSVLITHFHTDHIYGLIYMYKSGLKKYKRFLIRYMFLMCGEILFYSCIT